MDHSPEENLAVTPPFPVKHTFIHFGGNGRMPRKLRQGFSDPTDPRRTNSEDAKAGSSQECGNESHADLQETADETESCELVSLSESTIIATPELTPRNCLVSNYPDHFRRMPISLSDKLETTPVSSISPLHPTLTRQEPSTPPLHPRLAQEVTPDRTLGPREWRTSAASSPAPSSPALVPAVLFDGEGVFFTFTIRRADGVRLGLEVEPDDGNRALIVRGLREGGAIEAWNRQCVAGYGSGKAVMLGDKIVCVNSRAGCQDMLEEIKTRRLLKLWVVRGGPDYDASAGFSAGTAGELKDHDGDINFLDSYSEYLMSRLHKTPPFPVSPTRTSDACLA